MLQTGSARCVGGEGRAPARRAGRRVPGVRSPRTAYSREQRMRIVSLVPHATELLFALGLGEQVAGVTHERDYPPRARQLGRASRDALPAGLTAGQLGAAVRGALRIGEAVH